MVLLKGNEKFLLEEIVKKNFASKYKDSVLGILWSVLQPLLVMTLLTIIFSTLFGRAIENYPVYYLSGRCIFTFFSFSTRVSLTSIKGNKQIFEKTAAPKYIFVLGGVLSELINFFISVLILFAVMLVTHTTFYFNTIPLAIITVFFEFLLILGVGLILSIICMYFTDIQHLWSVITMLIMYSSALFYPMEIIPEPYHQIMILNPIFWFVNQFRCFVMWGQLPSLLNVINSMLISLIVLIIGIIIFKKYEQKVTLKY